MGSTIICNRQTGEFLTAAGEWTENEDEAKDFPSVFQALEVCCQCQLSEAELVFKFGDGPSYVSIPLSENPEGQEMVAANMDQDWAQV